MKRTAKQRHGLEVVGKRKKYADGGKVGGDDMDQETMDNLNASMEYMSAKDDQARRQARFAGAKKADFEGGGERVRSETSKPKSDLHRTVNGAPIRNPSPARLPPGAGGVRG